MKRLFLALVVLTTWAAAAWGDSIDEIIKTQDKARVKDEIVAAMLTPRTKKPITLKAVNDYQLIFEQEVDNTFFELMMMDLRTGKSPIIRTYFNILPQGDKIRVQSNYEVAASPGTQREMATQPGTSSQAYNDDLKGLLGFVRKRIEENYELTLAEVIQKYNEKPKIGIVADNSGKIIKVTPKTLAAKAGIKKGDMILEVNGEKVDNNAGMLLFEKIEAGHTLTLRMQRKQRAWNVKIQL